MRAMKRSLFYSRGFTIVELLIVIVVIGILAAITIVAYNGITGKADTAAVHSSAGQAARKLEAYKFGTSTSESYPSSLNDVNIRTSGNITYLYSVNNSASPKTYCMTALSGSTGYYVSNVNTSPVVGACPLTNLSTNPSVELAGTTGFVGQGSATITRVTTEAYVGTASLRVVTPGSGLAEGVLQSITPGNMPGRAFSTGIWVKAPAGTVLYNTTRTAGAGSEDAPQNIFTATGSWQFVKSENKIAQSDATSLQVHVRTANTAQAVTYYVDGAIMVEGPSLPGYYDGASSGWAWNGTVQGSTSTGLPI